MNIKYCLFAALLLAMSGFWLIDRTRQFASGKATCSESIQKAQADYEKRQEEKHKKEIERAVKEALDAANHIADISSDKEKEVEKTRVIIKTIPAAGCVPDDSFVRDFNKALDNLQRQ